ncbi:MAG: hypothetical protein DLM68_01875 [Hyphomicrobiales bacterium]|nr:MAG: hypothetical protein DLM68_01875 [Hyphomicrobiales bacterium]
MARPKKTAEELRHDQLKTRVTTPERVTVEYNATALGITIADFMRRRILGYRLPSVPAVQQRGIAALAIALLRIGVNLNQIAYQLNAGRAGPSDISAALSVLIARINAILDEIYGPGDNGGRAVL